MFSHFFLTLHQCYIFTMIKANKILPLQEDCFKSVGQVNQGFAYILAVLKTILDFNLCISNIMFLPKPCFLDISNNLLDKMKHMHAISYACGCHSVSKSYSLGITQTSGILLNMDPLVLKLAALYFLGWILFTSFTFNSLQNVSLSN